MILRNSLRYDNGKKETFFIKDGKISRSSAGETPAAPGNETVLDCSGLTVFPGFINSHEHLDFNLYPQLGKGPYPNYTAWGLDIQQQHKDTITAIKNIPEDLRVQWGLYKNLLNGFTTVVNHGKKLNLACPFLDVPENMTVLHSAAFEKYWKIKLNNPLQLRQKVCMHIGEGTDALAAAEPAQINRFNFFRRPVIAVHGVKLNAATARHFKALVWCPASNYFLFTETADIGSLSGSVPLLFGTDSTLTSSWNAWEHFRLAQKQPVTETQLVSMLTETPAKIWNTIATGRLEENTSADLLLLDRQSKPFTACNPEQIMLILKRGKPVLVDKEWYAGQNMPALNYTEYDEVAIAGRKKYVPAGLIALCEKIKVFYPEAVFPFTC